MSYTRTLYHKKSPLQRCPKLGLRKLRIVQPSAVNKAPFFLALFKDRMDGSLISGKNKKKNENQKREGGVDKHLFLLDLEKLCLSMDLLMPFGKQDSDGNFLYGVILAEKKRCLSTPHIFQKKTRFGDQRNLLYIIPP